MASHGEKSARGMGLSLVLLSAFFASLAGLFLRFVETADAWQIVFYRGAIFSAFLFAYLALRYGRGLPAQLLSMGGFGLLQGLTLSIAMTAFIWALSLTSVAMVVFIISTTPFFAALLGRAFLSESVSNQLWFAMAVAALGLAIMFAEGLTEGTAAGALLALVASVAYAATLVSFRKSKAADNLPSVLLAGLLASLFAASQIQDFSISQHDLGIAALLGIVQLGLQYILLVAGARHLPAAETAFVTRLSTVLAPLWVWLAVGEVPGAATLIGGAIVLSAVLFHSARRLRAARA
jgi:drug/metabolite transporter (DMT)-like permease